MSYIYYEHCRSRSSKQTMRLLQQGWEVVSESGSDGWFWGSSYKAILRRPKNGTAAGHPGLMKAYNK